MKRHYTDLPARKPRTVKAMRAFLDGHFRYNTMNSWNRAASYAVRIKVPHLNLTQEQRGRCYDLLSAEDCHEISGFNCAFENFAAENDYRWQIGCNGRSGGYAVLYEGGREPSGYKSRCRMCGQLNYTEATEENKQCGRCHANTRVNFTTPHMRTFSRPGCSVDSNGTDEMTSDDVRYRFKTVWEFDCAVEYAVANFVACAMEAKVEEITVMVPQKRTVARTSED